MHAYVDWTVVGFVVDANYVLFVIPYHTHTILHGSTY